MSTVKATNFQHASATNPAIVLAADGSATANVSSINGGPLAGMRNAIINGNFDHWQRGTSFSNPVSPSYQADRWQTLVDGSGATRTISRQSFTIGQSDVPGEPTYFIKYNQSVAGSGQTIHIFRQPIESVRTFAGQQITVSFYAKAASATTLPSVQIAQFFGTGGSPSATVFTTVASNVSITTSWQRFTYSVTLPSISGKTIGSDGNDWVSLSFNLPLNATFNIDIAQVQVEAGPVATPFERRPIGTELTLCQRYFQQTTAFAGVTSSGNELNVSGSAPFYVPMRANPTVTIPVGCTFHRPGVAFYAVSAVLLVQDASGGSYMTVTIAAGASTNTSGQITKGLLLSAEL